MFLCLSDSDAVAALGQLTITLGVCQLKPDALFKEQSLYLLTESGVLMLENQVHLSSEAMIS